jgi:hypothetical protein
MRWGGRKAREPNELELLLQSSLDRQKRQKKDHAKLELPSFFHGLIDDSTPTPTPIDYAFECRCWGTKHDVIDMCRQCGRVVCALEGERPCPFCGAIVLSEATRAKGGEEVARRTDEIVGRVSELRWIPEVARAASPPVEYPSVDFDTDWFDRELIQIFEDGPLVVRDENEDGVSE